MQALAQYVSFAPETFGPNGSRAVETAKSDSAGPPPTPVQAAVVADPGKGLRKGLTRAQVEALFGRPTETQDRTQENLQITTCTYQSATELMKADFINDVLVQYTVASR